MPTSLAWILANPPAHYTLALPLPSPPSIPELPNPDSAPQLPAALGGVRPALMPGHNPGVCSGSQHRWGRQGALRRCRNASETRGSPGPPHAGTQAIGRCSHLISVDMAPSPPPWPDVFLSQPAHPLLRPAPWARNWLPCMPRAVPMPFPKLSIPPKAWKPELVPIPAQTSSPPGSQARLGAGWTTSPQSPGQPGAPLSCCLATV